MFHNALADGIGMYAVWSNAWAGRFDEVGGRWSGGARESKNTNNKGGSDLLFLAITVPSRSLSTSARSRADKKVL